MDTQFYNGDGELNISKIEEMVLRANDWTELSNAEISRQAQMMQAEQIIQGSGWLDPMKENGQAELPSRFQSKEDMSSADWKNVLATKRQEILDARDAQAALKEPANPAAVLPVNKEVDEVKFIDKSYYMSKKFSAKDQEAQALIDTAAKEFSLNEAQKRAFRIVANHAVQSNGEHLKMYLGGMAGTGKSQVIKALTHFFAAREESYRFMCMAPTGSVVALID